MRIFAILPMVAAVGFGATSYSPDQLAELSVEQLLDSPISVSSVSRRPGSVQQSPAAVTVLTQEDIRRSGALSIPEALRMVPGMDVAKVDSHGWAISARGFNDLFANKLLVMVDGRSVYASLFSGTFWDVQDTVLEDIERIEVIRGPGASLWGANAVNGVINVITKKAANTQNLLVSAGGGDQETAFATIRYGGKIGEYLHYRVYGKYSLHDDSALFGTGFPEALIRLTISGGTGGSVGSAAAPPQKTHDAWSAQRAGFRLDFDPPGSDHFTVQGDIYRNREDETYQRITPTSFGTYYERDTDTASGGNILARWTHTFSNLSEFIFQTYYDRSMRDLAVLGEARNTFDLDFQHQVGWGERHTLIWGASYREISDKVRNTVEVALQPTQRSTSLYGAFLQDEIALVKKKLMLTLGTRFEHNDFTQFEFQPNVRLLWNIDQRNTLWAAVSRAVRTPSRAENDFRLTFPGVPINTIAPVAPAITIGIHGSQELESEKSTSFEAGYRTQISSGLGFELSLFHNKYRSLRSFAPTSTAFDFTKSPVEIIVAANNDASGETEGGELSAAWRLASWCRLSANYSLLRIHIHSAANVNVGSFGATSIEGTSPQQQAALSTWMDLSHGLELDTSLRYVDELPALNVPDYLSWDLRLGWRLSKRLEIALVGQNLLDSHHPEFKPSFFLSQATEVRRSIYAKVTIEY